MLAAIFRFAPLTTYISTYKLSDTDPWVWVLCTTGTWNDMKVGIEAFKKQKHVYMYITRHASTMLETLGITMDNKDALTQPWEEPFYLCTAYSLSAARRTDLLLLPTWFWEVVNLLVDRLGWLCLVEVRFQVTETTVAAQNFNSLLLDSGGSDPKILQTRESWVPHVCEVKLEKQKFKQSILQVE